MAPQSLLALSLFVFLQAACGNADANNQKLRDKNQQLNKQLDDRDQQLADAKTASASTSEANLALATEEKAKAEAMAAERDAKATALKDAEDEKKKAQDELKKGQDELKKGQDELKKAQDDLSATKSEVDTFKTEQQQLIINSLKPSDGLWLLDGEAADGCKSYLRFESASASLYQIQICADKTQVDLQKITRVGAERGAGWNGTVGLVLDTTLAASPCAEGLAKTRNYALDFSQATASANTTSSNILTQTTGDKKLTFNSAATKAILGKNRSCESLINRSKLESQQENAELQMAAKACQLTEKSEGLVCLAVAP